MECRVVFSAAAEAAQHGPAGRRHLYQPVPGYPGIGPYYYNVHYAEGYRLYDQIIGSWIGRSGDGIQAWSTYWFSGQNKIQVGYRRQYNESLVSRRWRPA